LVIKLYLASPYGFTDSGREFMEEIMVPVIQKASFEVLNPWNYSKDIPYKISKIQLISDLAKQIELWKDLNKEIGEINERMIKESTIVVAILEGTDVDSGVAAEIGYACALGKKILGYRSDFRLTGDNIGAAVNIQVEYFINKSGGHIVRKISDLIQALEKARKAPVNA
jgi:nucleoside 2-deoxyribosyltransferase